MTKVRKKPEVARCHYCDWLILRRVLRDGEWVCEITWDHKLAQIKGGGNGDNLVICCVLCNTLKGKMDYDLFVALLKKYPINPEVRLKLGGLTWWNNELLRARREWMKLTYQDRLDAGELEDHEVVKFFTYHEKI